MHYQSETIASILKRLNVNYFLPAIQREYVWRPDQIIQLFDSIMRNYPISSFLFWELEAENRYKWDVYQFIQNYKQDETHNEPTRTDGVQQLTLVLDGQQRLTSLLIGLKGTFTIKKKHLRWDSPGAWVKQRLYLDLLKDAKLVEDDIEEGLRYDFRFMEKAPIPDGKSHWFEVGHILNCYSRDQFYELRRREIDKSPESLTQQQNQVFDKNLDSLYQAIWKENFIAYYIEHEQNYDRVLTIFARANQGGTKLSKSDLLLSMVTAKWNEVNARDEIYEFVDRLNSDLTHKNNFDKDFIMKSCLVLTDLPVQYKVENFSSQNLKRIHDQWPRIKIAIEATISLVNSFGIDRDTLTSANALIPIIYYLYKHQGTTLRGSTPFEARNASHIRKWLLTVLLNNAFSGQSDNALRDTRRALIEQSLNEDFPFEAINAELRKSGRKASFDDDTIDTVLGFTYGKPLTFLALSLLYDDNRWGNLDYHQDHIFPRAIFDSSYMLSIGLTQEQQEHYWELENRIGNLQLLLAGENLEKSSQDFQQWLATRDPLFRKRHLIPEDDNLLSFDAFEKFIAVREEMIRQRLKYIIGMPSASQFQEEVLPFNVNEVIYTQRNEREYSQKVIVPLREISEVIYTDKQAAIHQLILQLVDENTQVVRDVCDQKVIRFGFKDWDVPVLKVAATWPPSGRILLFSMTNGEYRGKPILKLQLGLCQGPEMIRKKLFRMALANEPIFNPDHYNELPLKWIHLYQRTFLTPQSYMSLSDEALVVEIRKEWVQFIENDLPKLDAVLKAQPWIWQILV